SYTFTIAGNRNLVANFVAQTPTTYTVALSASPSNGGTVSGGGTFNEGINVTAHAAPMAGYTFVNWTENGAIVSTSVSYIFQVTSNRTLIANFQLVAAEEYTVGLSVAPVASGTVSGSGTFESGSSVTVSANAANGYNFLNWTEGDNVVSSNATYTFTITSDRDLKANFEPEKYTITLTANPSAGGFTNFSSNQFAFGQSVTINANENSNYKFVNWTENGVEVSTNKSYTFMAEANRSLVANFIPQTGVEDIEELKMSVYPNPTTGIVHVSGIQEGMELNITDVSGRLVHSVKADNTTVILDLSSFRHGIYFIRVVDKQFHYTKRVVLR
ncbi:MAG TPA: T9SS type A sorting domain-containing protein, partial [Prolixibacteraceae bacterium]|nr:T9SS type A sorting domain-containing protein [Prolixibacteraceae bacterium]